MVRQPVSIGANWQPGRVQEKINESDNTASIIARSKRMLGYDPNKCYLFPEDNKGSFNDAYQPEVNERANHSEMTGFPQPIKETQIPSSAGKVQQLEERVNGLDNKLDAILGLLQKK